MPSTSSNARRRVSSLSEFLKDARTASGLSQKSVADRLKYSSAQFISNWERGVSSPPLRVVRKLATMYKVSEQDLYEVMLRETLERAEADLRRKFFGNRRSS
jgi:transcriptional regulator with XRE-family HTH domain